MGARTFGAVIATALTAWGCGPTCDKEGRPGEETVFTGGTQSTNGDVYQTGDWCDPWLHIPNGRTFRLLHGLGRSPATLEVFVAFEAEPFGADCEGRGFAAPSAGNLVVIENVNAEYIQVRNDTCEPEFHFRLVAHTVEGLSPAVSDAGVP